jgi:hypothetical protein
MELKTTLDHTSRNRVSHLMRLPVTHAVHNRVIGIPFNRTSGNVQ